MLLLSLTRLRTSSALALRFPSPNEDDESNLQQFELGSARALVGSIFGQRQGVYRRLRSAIAELGKALSQNGTMSGIQ